MTEEFKPTQDVPVAEAKAEEQKLEWGPEFDKTDLYHAKKKVEELNSTLAKGERLWRLPTRGELLAEFNKVDSELKRNNPIPTHMGDSKCYWTGDSVGDEYPNDAWYVDMDYGNLRISNWEQDMDDFFVRLIRSENKKGVFEGPKSVIFKGEMTAVEFFEKDGKWFEKTSWSGDEKVREIGRVEVAHYLREHIEENNTEIKVLTEKVQELQDEIKQSYAVLRGIEEN